MTRSLPRLSMVLAVLALPVGCSRDAGDPAALKPPARIASAQNRASRVEKVNEPTRATTRSGTGAMSEPRTEAPQTTERSVSPPADHSGDSVGPRLIAALPASIAAPKKAADGTIDPFVVPDVGPNGLVDFIAEVQEIEADARSEAGLLAHQKKVASAVAAAAQKLLALHASDDHDLAAASVAFQSLMHLNMLGDEQAMEQLIALRDAYQHDPRAEMRSIVRQNAMMMTLLVWDDADDATRNTLLSDFTEFLETNNLNDEQIQFALQIGDALEQAGDLKRAGEAYRALAGKLAESDPAELRELAGKVAGMARRTSLPGSEMEVFGTRLDGAPLAWSKYRGKVVLVDFWATWCGPCIDELPNILANYRKYHDRGFEVIGVALDDDRAAVERFVRERSIPWPVLLEADPDQRGWNHPLVTHYGINGIPTAILVDRQGKVVSLNAKGPELEEQLQRLLGATAEAADGSTRR